MSLKSKYHPQTFAPMSMDHAKEIVLSTGANEKWEAETAQTVSEIILTSALAGKPISPNSVLLDFGCGIGRIAKGLIEKTKCTVIGVDASPGMLELSFQYLRSENFVPCSVAALNKLLNSGLQFDGAYSVWVLQHCLDPDAEIKTIFNALKPESLFYVTNMNKRFVPTTPTSNFANWMNDHIDVHQLLKAQFAELNFRLNPEESFTGLFQKK